MFLCYTLSSSLSLSFHCNELFLYLFSFFLYSFYLNFCRTLSLFLFLLIYSFLSSLSVSSCCTPFLCLSLIFTPRLSISTYFSFLCYILSLLYSSLSITQFFSYSLSLNLCFFLYPSHSFFLPLAHSYTHSQN